MYQFLNLTKVSSYSFNFTLKKYGSRKYLGQINKQANDNIIYII